MRLICPNCGAQYEVDDKVIPEAGRDVQCSNCGHTWFQRPAHLDPELAEELGHEVLESGDAPETSSPDEPPKNRRGLDPDTANILREEAAHEADVRRKEASGLESQPDLGLDDASDAAADKSAAARARMARMRGMDDNGTAAAAAAAAGSRRDLLPDIEEINSTLRASGDRESSETTADPAPIESDAKPRRRGFRLGFLLSMLVVACAALVYRFAPQIVEAAPQSEPYLTSYVDWANTTRGQLNANIDRAIDWVSGQIANLTGGES
jgi:predicted Zn finger-like uncharacterized protein